MVFLVQGMLGILFLLSGTFKCRNGPYVGYFFVLFMYDLVPQINYSVLKPLELLVYVFFFHSGWTTDAA